MTVLRPSDDQLTRFGLDPAWSRQVTFEGADGEPVTWNILDTGHGDQGTIVCVHGNPTWSYLWRNLSRDLSPQWRVIAVDQTGMGFSQRGPRRTLAQRITELVTFCETEVNGPLILAAHDWGGAIALGAAPSLPVTRLILSNTAVGLPDGVAMPPLIGIARTFVGLVCRWTLGFVQGTALMTEREHRRALRAPYRGWRRRRAVADFVADIPIHPRDVSYDALRQVADSLKSSDTPALLVWGGRDVVFHDGFLTDLESRLSHVDVERFADCAHLAPLDKRFSNIVQRWLDTDITPRLAISDAPLAHPIYSVIDDHVDDPSPVFIDSHGALSWQQLASRRAVAARALRARGIGPGDRVAILVKPSGGLLVTVAALWAVGAVPVVADNTGGIRQLRNLLRAAAPVAVIGTSRTLLIDRLCRLTTRTTRLCISGRHSITRGPALARDQFVALTENQLAAIVHTSGSTGPAKAVTYTHGALAAQRDLFDSWLPRDKGGAFTTSFAPFMLLAPALERLCLLPDIPFDQPERLTMSHLDTLSRHAPLEVAWFSPAAARNLVATSSGRRVPLAHTFLAGAAIDSELAASLAELTGGSVAAPYGMTECLPVTDGVNVVADTRGGTATGRLLPGCSVVIAPLGDPTGRCVDGEWGEILVSAPWMFSGYRNHWVENATGTINREGQRFHRTGDVGYLSEGELFYFGRRIHVITTSSGPVASVAVEEAIRRDTSLITAAVGVGPAGAQVVVVVVAGHGKLQLATADVAAAARAASPVPLAAVLTGEFPVDHRHHSKIDRVLLARQSEELLLGR